MLAVFIAAAIALGIVLANPLVASIIPFPAGWLGAACLAAGAGIAKLYWSRSGADNAPAVQERQAWLTLVMSAMILGYFFASRLWSPVAASAMFSNIAILQITWIAATIGFSLFDRGGRDERDREIERRAYRHAYLTLIAYIGGAIWMSFSTHHPIDNFESLRYTLIGALLVGPLAESCSRLYLYRRDAI